MIKIIILKGPDYGSAIQIHLHADKFWDFKNQYQNCSNEDRN